jgi:hypothetical protein
MLYLQHDFYNIIFKIKLCIVPRSAPPPPSKEKFCVQACFPPCVKVLSHIVNIPISVHAVLPLFVHTSTSFLPSVLMLFCCVQFLPFFHSPPPNIQGVSRLVYITAGGDFLSLCDQKSSYEHVSDFGRLRSYGRLKLTREGNDNSQ